MNTSRPLTPPLTLASPPHPPGARQPPEGWDIQEDPYGYDEGEGMRTGAAPFAGHKLISLEPKLSILGDSPLLQDR